MCHGGGCTPVGQTPDTDLNQHVRREYGMKETTVLLEKMRAGKVVPKLSNEECMVLMLEVLSDPALHMQAAKGYKSVGQSIDLHGREDELVCREAGVYWREKTTDGWPSMRPKIDAELAAVEDEFKNGGITWCQKDVQRLIRAYPAHKKVDRVLANLGEDFYHDDIHCLEDGDDVTADAEVDQEVICPSSDEDSGNDEPSEHVPAAVAGQGAENSGSAELEGSGMESAPLSANEADELYKVKGTMATLEATIEGLRAIGQVRGVQFMEAELAKEQRKVRALVNESPAVADAFSRLRRAEVQERLMDKRVADQHKERKQNADKVLSDKKAAADGLRKLKRKTRDVEGIYACRHALKHFTLESLGGGDGNAGGTKARKVRHEVLDRLARIGAGLSPGQRNDWTWFKETWDTAMVNQHGTAWASLFMRWMQSVLEEESNNAFSMFMHKESCRIFGSTAALHVPGV